MTDYVVTPAEAADMLGISKRTADGWCQTGKMPGLLPKIGRYHRISRTALERYLNGEAAS